MIKMEQDILYNEILFNISGIKKLEKICDVF